MANIGPGDIVYTQKDVYSAKIAGLPPRRKSLISVAMGNAANKTYPTGGIAPSAAGLGMASFLESVVIIDTTGSEDEIGWTWDFTNQKFRLFTSEGTEKSGAFTNNTQTLVVEATGF